MSNQLLKGRSFSPGDTVDAADLNNLVDLATALGPLVSAQPSVSAATGDSIIISDVSDSGNLKKALVSSLPGAGTVTSVSTVIDSGSAVLNFSVGSPTTTPVFHIGLDNQGPNKVLAGPVSGTATTPSFRVLTPADLPSATVIAIAALDIDWSLGSVFTKTLPNGAGNSAFTFSNIGNGQTIKVRLLQGTGSHTASWPSVVWRGTGPAPVVTPGANARDIFTFTQIAGLTYGYADQNFTV